MIRSLPSLQQMWFDLGKESPFRSSFLTPFRISLPLWGLTFIVVTSMRASRTTSTKARSCEIPRNFLPVSCHAIRCCSSFWIWPMQCSQAISWPGFYSVWKSFNIKCLWWRFGSGLKDRLRGINLIAVYFCHGFARQEKLRVDGPCTATNVHEDWAASYGLSFILLTYYAVSGNWIIHVMLNALS